MTKVAPKFKVGHTFSHPMTGGKAIITAVGEVRNGERNYSIDVEVSKADQEKFGLAPISKEWVYESEIR